MNTTNNETALHEQQRPLTKLYVTRTFSEKLSATMDFIRENFRQLFQISLYLLLPISVLQAFFNNDYMGSYVEMITQISKGASSNSALFESLPSLLGMLLLQYVGMFLTVAMIYAMMRLYEQRPNRLVGITLDELRPGILKMFGRELILLITYILMVIPVIGIIIAILMAISPAMVLLALVLIIVAMPLLALLSPIYLFEDRTGVFSAYAKSFRLGWKTWGGIVALVIVLGILAYIIMGILSGPFYIMVFLKSLLSATSGDEPAFTSSFAYSALTYIMGVISCFGAFTMTGLIYIGLAYQYGHACDKVDGVSVDRDIENFEELK